MSTAVAVADPRRVQEEVVASPHDSNSTGIACKSAAVAEVLRDNGLMQTIGCSWRLFMLLVFLSGGRVINTWDEIGRAMGTNGSTARKWATHMRKAEVADITTRGKRVEVALTERYMRIAQAPETLPTVPPAEHPVADSPRLVMLRHLAEVAEEVGSKLEVKVVI